MGISFSCPVSEIDEFDSRFESSRSVSFNGRDSEPTKMKSFNSAKMIFEGALSFNGRELETTISFKASPSSDKDGNGLFVRQVSFKRTIGDQMARFGSLSEEKPKSGVPETGNHRYQAALKLQKVYKSFRTRRQLADCAVLVEQRWWKVLDFAELKRSSISFFDIEKPETAVSRWARARTRAAKVGKGLSKDEKARKLALQHWLEAIDPRHRYGHNLQFYYLKWLHCDSKQPFFYWLDIGEGKEVTSDRCPRSKLQQQCIKYLGPAERKAYEVLVDNGRFIYKQSGELLDTRGGPPDVKWIFVLSVSKTLYVGQKCKGTFQHSSFLAGGATLSAGRLVVEDGILKAVWPHSGHYLPTEENFQEFLSLLKENNVDLTNVQKSPTEEGEESLNFKKQDGIGLPYNQSEADLSQYSEEVDAQKMPQNTTDSPNQDSNAAKENHKAPLSRLSRRLCSKITRLEIPKRNDPVFLDMFKKEEVHQDSPTDDGYETAEESFLSEEDFIFPKLNLFEEDEEDENETPISKEQILSRIISHRGLRSYQLAHQLSSKWTTGAGPRIGCMRDYPSELRFRVLEQQNLSPRGRSTHISPKVLTSTRLCRVTNCSTKSPPTPEQVMLSKLASP